ncbi:MAG TPA: ABC transporter permease [Chryseosolibacter sp.]|nr:ABC transporter permease [Chryseosolibacter sp.]
MKSLHQLILINFKSFFREPAILFWAILFPIIMPWILGIAFSNKGESLRTVYVTGDPTTVEKISGEQVYGTGTGNTSRIRFERVSEDEALRAIKRGIITVYIEVQGDSLVYHFDPLNPDAQLTHLLLDREINGIKKGNARTTIQELQTVGTRYVDFLIPGLIALGIMNSCIWGIGWTLIETRMKKLLRRMVATPMRKSIFLTSHVLTRIALGAIETCLLLAFAFFYFDTRISGSIFAFVIVFLSGIFAFSGIAILIASRTSKTEVANGLVNAVTLPMMILSGIFFNYHNFPDWAIPIIQALPLTLVADSIRSVFIESAGLADVGKAIAILNATGLVTFVVGMRSFRWY